jgi:hypothetical protein
VGFISGEKTSREFYSVTLRHDLSSRTAAGSLSSTDPQLALWHDREADSRESPSVRYRA